MTKPSDAAGFRSFESLYLHAPCGLVSTTIDGRILEVNDTLLRWTGFDRDTLTGTPFEELLDTGTRMFYETRYLPVLRLGGEVREVALTLKRANDDSLPIFINSVMQHDADGNPVTHIAVFDATERKGYEQQLVVARRAAESSARRLKALQDASSAFAASNSEAELELAMVASARAAFLAREVALMMVDAAGELRVVAGVHPLDAEFASLGRRPESVALATGGVTVAPVEGTEPEVTEALARARYTGMSVAPMLDGDRAIGVFVCFFARARDFDAPFFELQEALARQATEVFQRVRLQDQLKALAAHDQLTGLANRTQLQERLSVALARATSMEAALALIFIDLDGFKAVNDELGHGVGDAVLTEVADRLRSVVRSTDVVARFGGDEFVIVCENVNSAVAGRIAEDLRLAVARPYAGLAARLSVTASVGLAVIDVAGHPDVTTDDLLNRADNAMYASKNSGKDTVTIDDSRAPRG